MLYVYGAVENANFGEVHIMAQSGPWWKGGREAEVSKAGEWGEMGGGAKWAEEELEDQR